MVLFEAKRKLTYDNIPVSWGLGYYNGANTNNQIQIPIKYPSNPESVHDEKNLTLNDNTTREETKM